MSWLCCSSAARALMDSLVSVELVGHGGTTTWYWVLAGEGKGWISGWRSRTRQWGGIMEGLLVRNLPRARTQDTRLFLLISVVAPVSSGTISLEALLPQMLLVCGPSRSHPFLLFDNLLPQSHLFLQSLHVERLLFTLRITKLIINNSMV